MKSFFIKTAACLLVVPFLLGGCSPGGGAGSDSAEYTISSDGFDDASVNAEQSSQNDEIDFEQYQGYGFLGLQNDAERMLYANIDKAVRQITPQGFSTPMLDDLDHISDVLDFYLYDHPDVFWIQTHDSYNCTYYENDSKMVITLKYSFFGDDLIRAKEELYARQRSVLDGAPDGDYERERYFHDYLMNNCEYDEAALSAREQQVYANESTAYGALVEHKAVCEGYALAFELLCMESGIPSWVVTGMGVDSDGSEEYHIWNIVQLDGSWYHVDVTWDDPDEETDYEIYQYLFFNVTDDEIRQDHIISPLYSDYSATNINYNVFLPQCTDTAYSYYRRNSALLSSLDGSEPAAYLAQQVANGVNECVFRLDSGMDLTDTYNAILEDYAYDWLTAANEINGYSPAVADTCRVSYSKTRRLITIDFDYL